MDVWNLHKGRKWIIEPSTDSCAQISALKFLSKFIVTVDFSYDLTKLMTELCLNFFVFMPTSKLYPSFYVFLLLDNTSHTHRERFAYGIHCWWRVRNCQLGAWLKQWSVSDYLWEGLSLPSRCFLLFGLGCFCLLLSLCQLRSESRNCSWIQNNKKKSQYWQFSVGG